MNLLRTFLARLRAVLTKRALDDDFAEELAQHLEAATADNIRAGMTPAEAARRARVALGGVEQTRELHREARGLPWLEHLAQDLSYGARMLRRSPGFTIVAVLTLALGIGLNTGIFSMFKAVALRPLPGVPDSAELVALLWTSPGGDQQGFSHLDLIDFRERCRSFRALEGTAVLPFSVQLGDRAQRVWGEYATGNQQAMLGVTPALGRLLIPEDDRVGGELVVVVSHRFWQQRLGAASDVVGRNLVINGQSFTIVGVTQPGFAGTTVGFALDVYLPAGAAGRLRLYGAAPEAPYAKRDFHWLAAVGRLRPGVSVAQARAEVEAVGVALAREHPAELKDKRAQLVDFRQSPFGAQTYLAPMFGVLMGMTALVLLIMCANVASLLLARATVREHEMAIRLAIGAGRGRIVRQLLTESAVLAVAGGGLGALLAQALPTVLAATLPSTRYPFRLNVEPDFTVFLFALAVSAGSALVFGLVPALQASRPDLVPALKNDRRGRGAHPLWGRNALVVAQIAIALPLLAAAGLILRSYRNALRADFGFAARNVALLSVDLGANGYDATRGRSFNARLLEQLEGLPGVEAASLAQSLPLCTVPALQAAIDVDGYVRSPQEARLLLYNAVSRDYFRTLRIPVVSGREFEARDTEESLPVAVINETFAQRYWPGANAVGRRFTVHGSAHEVIGVARDVKYLTASEAPRPYFYVALTQHHAAEVVVQVRGAGDARQLGRAAQEQVARLDPHLPVFSAETLPEYLDFALSMQTLGAGALALAGGFGLLLAGMGTFGLVSFVVGSRAREIGVRMALGATRTSVVLLVMRQGMRLAAAGVVLGLAGALVAARFMKGLLYGVEPTDVVTLGAALLVVAGMALLACWLPARRATRVDPLVALRAE